MPTGIANSFCKEGPRMAEVLPVLNLNLPLAREDIAKLNTGDKVLLFGELFTARDKAHARLCAMIAESESLPFDLAGICLFYCGPSPAPQGNICGAIGPTTSARMDAFTPLLLEHGLRCMIGKGDRSSVVCDAIRSHKAVYFAATGGISALLSQSVVSCETFIWGELGTEAIYRLVVKDFPCYVHTI